MDPEQQIKQRPDDDTSARWWKKYHTPVLSVLTGVLFCAYFFYFFIATPSVFPVGSVVSVSAGENLKEVTKNFKDKNIIKSSVMFQSLVIIFGGEKRVIAGDYLLDNRQNSVMLAWRIVHGEFAMHEVKVTIPEGYTVADIADLLQKKLVTFNKPAFLAQTRGQEGYLFPDTYFFPPTATTVDIVSRMKENFNQKIQQYNAGIARSGHSQYDVLKMASILEAEATSTHDRQIVAGILWNRIHMGMALQVDASLKYATGRGTADLTVDDLKINSGYNTYTHTGLPPTPIDNPGTDAISSAINPIQTKYIYFLTGRDGAMHYAVTFEEHKRNKEKWL